MCVGGHPLAGCVVDETCEQARHLRAYDLIALDPVLYQDRLCLSGSTNREDGKAALSQAGKCGPRRVGELSGDVSTVVDGGTARPRQHRDDDSLVRAGPG